MAIARQENDAACLCLFDKIEQTLAFGWHRRPSFPTMRRWHDLDRGGDQANVSGLLQLVFQPRPLRRAEHVLHAAFWRWHVTLFAFRTPFVRGGQTRTEKARIQHDHLGALTFWSEAASVIRPWPLADILIFQAPEDFMNALSHTAERKLAAGIIGAIIMVIPRHHHRCGFPHFLKVLARREVGKGFLHFIQERLIVDIGTAIAVAIYIIANHQEKIRLFRWQAHHRCRRAFFFVEARANQNLCQNSIRGRQRHPGRCLRQSAVRNCVIIIAERIFDCLGSGCEQTDPSALRCASR